MNYIEFLDLPAIPENFIETLAAVDAKPARPQLRIHAGYKPIRIKDVSPELFSWLQSIFPFEIIAQYQLIELGLPMHKDRSRTITYNYLLHSGGKCVSTVVYSDSVQVLQQEIIPLKQWHKIEVSYLHYVAKLEPGQVRMSISVVPQSAIIH